MWPMTAAQTSVVDSGSWPWKAGSLDTRPEALPQRRPCRFTTHCGSGLESVRLYGMGVAIGEFDNDGYDDIVVNRRRRKSAFCAPGRNRAFSRTSRAGRGSGPLRRTGTRVPPLSISTTTAADLFVCRYVRWSPDIDRQDGFPMTGIGRAYGPPKLVRGSYPAAVQEQRQRDFPRASARRPGCRVVNPATGKPIGKSLACCRRSERRWLDDLVSPMTTSAISCS